jgi:two-component system chemotaxis sensor kinase CheA
VDVGLVVDAFHEGAEVILKPMEGVVADSRLFCGTALMGDGSVLLVLDVKEVLTVARDHV